MDPYILLNYLPMIIILTLVSILILYFYISGRNYAKFIISFTKKNNYKLWEEGLDKKLKNKSFIYFKNQIKEFNKNYDFKCFNEFFQKISNVFEFEINGIKVIIFSYSYSRNKSSYNFKGAILNYNSSEKQIPNLNLKSENFFTSLLPDIDFDENKIFSKKYRLTSNDEREVRQFFTNDRLKSFEINQILGDIEVNNNSICYLEEKAFSNKEESYNQFIQRVKNIIKLFD